MRKTSSVGKFATCHFYETQVSWPQMKSQPLSEWQLSSDDLMISKDSLSKEPLCWLYQQPGAIPRASAADQTKSRVEIDE